MYPSYFSPQVSADDASVLIFWVGNAYCKSFPNLPYAPNVQNPFDKGICRIKGISGKIKPQIMLYQSTKEG